MPGGRLAAEAAGEALQERLRQRDFGEQDERLLSLAQAFGDCFKIDFGFPEPVTPSSSTGSKPLPIADERLAARFPCSSFSSGGAKSGSGRGKGAVGLDRHRFKRARVDEPAHHRVADLGMIGELADCALPALDCG